MTNSRVTPPAFLNPLPANFRTLPGYVSADAPSIVCKSTVLYNNSMKNLVLKTNFDFINISTNLNSTSYNWYKNDDVLPDLRVRFIMSFDPQTSKIMDFLSKRFNEYQAGLMAEEGSDNVTSFYNQISDVVNNSFARQSPEDAILSLEKFDQIMSTSGFFDTIDLTRTLKNSPGPILNYNTLTNNPISNVVLYDASISNLLIYDDNKNVITRPGNGLPPSLNQISGADNYNFEFVSTLGLEVDIGKLGYKQYSDNFSLYAFCYYDYQAFLDRIGNELNLQTFENGSSLKSGMGFVDQRTFAGVKTSYVNQEGDVVQGPSVVSEQISPDSQNFVDARVEQNLSPDNLKNKIHDTFYKTSVGPVGLEKTMAQTIESNNYFSDLWISKDTDENTRFSFAFDLASYLSEQSSFPFLYVSPGTKKELLEGGNFLNPEEISKVVEIRLNKRRVKKDAFVSSNNLQTSEKSKTYFDDRLKHVKYLATTIRNTEIFLPEGLNEYIEIHEALYTNSLERKTQTPEKCQYGADVIINDSSLLFLGRIEKEIESLEKSVRDIYEMIVTSPQSAGIYDQATQERRVSLSGLMVEASTADQVLEDAIDFYISILNNFGIIEDITTEIIGDELDARVGQNDPSGIKYLADSINVLLGEINSVLKSYHPNSTLMGYNVEHSKVGTSRTGKNSILRTEHYFKDYNDYSMGYGSGYSFLRSGAGSGLSSILGLSRISKDDHLARAQSEFSKYFNIQGDAIPDALTGGFSNSSITYYSPLEVKLYGQESISQLSFKKDQESALDFDFNKYALIFLNMISLKNKNTPFQFFGDNVVEQGIEGSLISKTTNAMSDFSCTFSEEITSKFSDLSPKNVKDDIETVVQRNKENKKNNNKISGLILGGADDSSPASQEQQDAVNQEIVDKDFANVKSEDPKDTPSKQKKKLATKLLFNIIGEMDINHSTNTADTTSYMDLQFNSLTKLSSLIGANSQNILSILNEYSFMPNQLKAVIVLSVMNEELGLENGIDAVRPRLKDKVELSSDSFLSALFNDAEYPPYERTGDPMKVYAKMAAFWLNYKQLAAVEYLAGFSSIGQNAVSSYFLQTSNNDSYYYKTKMPIWKKFNRSFYESNLDKTFLCRLRGLNETDYVGEENLTSDLLQNLEVEKNDFFDLPIYDKYFLLTGQSGE
jgi:hypothetical protein